MNWDLLAKALSADLTPLEKEQFNNWLAASTQNQSIWEALQLKKQTLLNLVTETDTAEQWQRIQLEKGTTSKKTAAQKFPWYALAGCAAALVLLFVVRISTAPWSTNSNRHMVTIKAGQNHKKIQLPDGSTVWLHYNSQLNYDSNSFNQTKRDLVLEGDAFFDVAKNKEKPFQIWTKTLKVRVTGTSFSVYASAGKPQQIKVATGTVLVSGNNLNEQLTAGMALLYDPSQHKKERATIALADATAIQQHRLSFDHDNLYQIAQKLEQWYHINIHIQGLIRQPVSFTGIINDDGLDQVLKGLGYVAGFTYATNANQLIIYPQQ